VVPALIRKAPAALDAAGAAFEFLQTRVLANFRPIAHRQSGATRVFSRLSAPPAIGGKRIMPRRDWPRAPAHGQRAEEGRKRLFRRPLEEPASVMAILLKQTFGVIHLAMSGKEERRTRDKTPPLRLDLTVCSCPRSITFPHANFQSSSALA
jgi:hypothetical protein